MNRKPTGWLPRIVCAFAITAVLSLAACGGGEEVPSPRRADGTAGVKPADLDALMLQAEDLPQGFSYDVSSDVPSVAGLGEPEQRVAGRHLRSLLEESLQEDGKTVCIVSDLELYVSADDAAARWAEEWRVVEEMAAAVPAEGGVWENLVDLRIGDEAGGFFLSAPRVSFCGWQAVAGEVVSVTFWKGRLLADVRTYTLGQGASTDQAVELARKLLARIEAALGEQ
jgi:hypothetical protein